MAAFLLALPPEVIAENPEAQVYLKKDLISYRAEQLSQLNLTTPAQKIELGGMRGAEKYTWPGPDSLILHTAFLFPAGAAQNKDVMRVTTLVRQKDCVHLGSRWEVSNVSFVPSLLRLPIAKTALLEMSKRTFKEINTLKIETQVAGPFGSRARLLLDAMAAEKLAGEGSPVDTSVSRIACQTAGFGASLYPSRAHRTLVVRLNVDAHDFKKNGEWPWVQGSGAIYSGVFGDKNTDLFSLPKFEIFDPAKIVEGMSKAVPTVSHDLRNSTFRVLKRVGHWIYLDRGRAFGLEIGMHLLGPNKSELHIIQFAPGNLGPGGSASASASGSEPGVQKTNPKATAAQVPTSSESVQPDVAVAFLRKEDSSNPVKPGDSITFDLTNFPKK